MHVSNFKVALRVIQTKVLFKPSGNIISVKNTLFRYLIFCFQSYFYTFKQPFFSSIEAILKKVKVLNRQAQVVQSRKSTYDFGSKFLHSFIQLKIKCEKSKLETGQKLKASIFIRPESILFVRCHTNRNKSRNSKTRT